MAIPKLNITAPNQKAWSAWLPVKVPTSGGNTGMIRPIEIMSISTVTRMNGMAARVGAADKSKGVDIERVTPCGSSALPW